MAQTETVKAFVVSKRASGDFRGVMLVDQLSATSLQSVNSNSDIFVVRYTSMGALTWARRFGGTGNDQGFGVATRGGLVVVTGSIGATVDFGGGPRQHAGGDDIALFALNP